MGKTLIFYRTADGKCPVQEFLDSLSGKVAQKVAWVMSLVEDLDVVPSTYFKKLVSTDEIWSAEYSLAQTRTGYSASSTAILLWCSPTD